MNELIYKMQKINLSYCKHNYGWHETEKCDGRKIVLDAIGKLSQWNMPLVVYPHLVQVLAWCPTGIHWFIYALSGLIQWYKLCSRDIEELIAYQVLICWLVHICVIRLKWINSSPPNVAYMCQWIDSASVQIMACRLFGAKPLSEPMLIFCKLDP